MTSMTEHAARRFTDEDTVGAWMSECCDVGGKFYGTLIDLFWSWQVWAIERGEPIGSSEALAKALDARPELMRCNHPGTNRAGWYGLRAKQLWDEAEEVPF